MFTLSSFIRYQLQAPLLLSPLCDYALKNIDIDQLEASLRCLTLPGSLHSSSKLKEVLDDLIQCSDTRKVRLCKDLCRLAHTAGHYTRCAELFFSCRKLSPLVLNDIVVDAAALTLRPEYLQKCLSCMDSGTTLTEGPSSYGTLLALRIYWHSTRCFVEYEHLPLRGNNVRGEVVLNGVEVEAEERETILTEYRDISLEAFRLLHLPGDVLFDSWWSKTKRLVLYHEIDKGEAAVYEQFFFHCERNMGNKKPVWFSPQCLVSMMRSCVKAEEWDISNRYVELAISYLTSGDYTLDDGLLQQCFIFFHISMQSQRGAILIRQIRNRFPSYVPTVSVVQSIAKLAGDVSDEELAIWCLQSLLNECQVIPPSSDDIFISLKALAKCRAKNFRKLLDALGESGVIKLTKEQWLYLELVYSRRSLCWEEEEVSKRIEAAYVNNVTGDLIHFGFSLRNAGLLLRILQEVEHAGFMNYYRRFKREFNGHAMLEQIKAEWLVIALKWASTQPMLDRNDYESLVKEAHSFIDDETKDSTPVLINRSLRLKIRRRLTVIEQLWGKTKYDNTTALPLSGDTSLVPFVKQRYCFSKPYLPKMVSESERIPSNHVKGHWRASDILASLAQREWNKVIQSGN
ncbi:hypothetical protein LSM04_007912 [Trypanosoma melophagium]|uniref:uncharacterized protein n=1 Tax=Trypanosoma melophagium TaxID=715481 RepID=UPI00351A11E2|nr:hypothetical protein LSM04_007912 [Trypanosoma melophagium]